MAVTQRGAVYIPVALYPATQDNNIRFNQLAKDKDGNLKRVQYKKTCAGCGRELSPGDIVKGFQYDKDRYVVVTDDDFEKIKTEKDRAIKITQFTDPGSIPEIYFNKSYYVVGDKGGEKPFELLRKAMAEENKIAIGTTVLGNSETVVAILAEGDGLMVKTLFYQDEIREMPEEAARPDVGEGELDMAKKLIETMEKPFDPSEFHDEYQNKLNDMIQAKIAGQEIVAPREESANNIINLMDALKASIENNKPQKKAGQKRKKTGS